MSEHEESAEPGPAIPDQQATQPGHGPHSDEPGDTASGGSDSRNILGSGGGRDRGQRAAAFAGALTSRTAGWIVAAGLTGSLVTLLLNPSTAQPVAGQVTIRNAGQVTPAVRSSWQIARSPVTPWSAYVMPGGPPMAGAIQWTVDQACAIPGAGSPPFAKRRTAIIAPPGAKRVYIHRHGRHQIAVKIARVPWSKSMRLVRPGCAVLSLHCRVAMSIGPGPGIAPVIVKRKGRVVIIRPGRRGATWSVARAKAPHGKRVFVVSPGARVSALPGPQCIALRSAPGR